MHTGRRLDANVCSESPPFLTGRRSKTYNHLRVVGCNDQKQTNKKPLSPVTAGCNGGSDSPVAAPPVLPAPPRFAASPGMTVRAAGHVLEAPGGFITVPGSTGYLPKTTN